MEIPYINCLKMYKLQFVDKNFINLPTDSTYGNLNLSWGQIVIRIECLNEQIEKLYVDFYRLRGIGWSTLDEGYKRTLLTEQIFYWLRKTTDECLSIIYLLDFHKLNKHYPKSLIANPITDLINNKDRYTSSIFDHARTLTMIRDISNCYKHSFMNAQLHNHIGSEYPVVFAYSLHNNDRNKEPKLYCLNMKEVLKNYNSFLETCYLYIKTSFEVKK